MSSLLFAMRSNHALQRTGAPPRMSHRFRKFQSLICAPPPAQRRSLSLGR
jgi:hypothetical protein